MLLSEPAWGVSGIEGTILGHFDFEVRTSTRTSAARSCCFYGIPVYHKKNNLFYHFFTKLNNTSPENAAVAELHVSHGVMRVLFTRLTVCRCSWGSECAAGREQPDV